MVRIFPDSGHTSCWRSAQRTALRSLFSGSTWLHQSGSDTLDAVDIYGHVAEISDRVNNLMR